jgi:PDZ domain
MKRTFAIGLLVSLTSACAMQMVEKDAKESCAAQRKEAFITEAKQNGIPLFVESARAQYLCIGPDDITHLPSTFGADAFWATSLNGVGIVSVTQGSVAERAGLKSNDVVHEFAGIPIARTEELQSAIGKMSPGGQAIIKVRRKGQDAAVTARF